MCGGRSFLQKVNSYNFLKKSLSLNDNTVRYNMSLKVGPKSPSNNNLLFNIGKFTVIISTGYF